MADPQPNPHPRWPLILGLLVLAPVCAEYLAAYADSTGDIAELALGLLILSPLYGAPALIIREVARRRGLGWGGMALMAAAFGMVQAGTVDQSLFSLGYLGIESWEASRRPTLIPSLGFSAYLAQLFIAGHVIYSICAPIAIVEAFQRGPRTQPWLRTRGLVMTALLYLSASVFVLFDHLSKETSHASLTQVVVTLLVASTLVVAAFRLAPGERIRSAEPRKAPRATTAFVLSVVGATVVTAASETWLGVVLALTVLGFAVVALVAASRSADWGERHQLAVAAGALTSRALLAFTYLPVMGVVSPTAKYAHNAVLLGLVVLLSGLAAWRVRNPHSIGEG